MSQMEPTPIHDRLELFVDDALIESLAGHASLRLHRPTPREVAITTDRPWEGNMCGGYKTILRADGRFRMYYQAWNGVLETRDGKTKFKDHPIRIAVIESDDGIHWTRPELGVISFEGSTANNLVFEGFGPEAIGVHGFSPFLDTNPACDPAARFKALGASNAWPYKLYALKSADGYRWSMLFDEPVITRGAFDSQNVAFWDSLRGEYRAYIRDFNEQSVRGIKTCTSADLKNWTPAEWLEYPGSPIEALYTNMVTPYHRAPHLLLGFPTRYVERPWSPTIEALPEVEHRRVRSGVSPRYGTAVTDGLFMAGRDGRSFKRWDEAFIRPGPRKTGSWAYGDCYQGLGLIETASDLPDAPDELSMFVSEGYWRGSANAIRRYSLRVDGFVSLHAPLSGGELITRPLRFAGDSLALNVSTSAGGEARVELQSSGGRPIDGFSLEDCHAIVGDDLAYRVNWRGGSLAKMAGQPVRVRFQVRDADVFSFRFQAAGI